MKSDRSIETISYEKNANYFVPNYYNTKSGSEFAGSNLPKIPSIDFMMRQ